MKGTLAIIGSGHLGQQIAHFAISDKHYHNVVFFDDFSNEETINGYRVLGNSNDIETKYNEHFFDELIIGVGYKHLSVRRDLFKRFEHKIPFGTIIHSSCWVDQTAEVKAGAVVYPSCIVDSNTVIGANSIINIGCSIAHDTVVGEHCFLSPRVAVAGFVNIGEQCIIGINATLIDNITIVDKTQIGGGTVVIKSIDTSGLYVGNPFKFVR
jgi:sugar O-acyltransferase (sialic acid O-acetyltransferase NeuD family)